MKYPIKNEVQTFPGLLLVAGAGRKRGKTLLICNILRRWGKTNEITAVKITKHVHNNADNASLILQNAGFTIWQETVVSRKDTGRYIEAGAAKVFYVETDGTGAGEAFLHINTLTGPSSLVICESGSLAEQVRPGVMVFVRHPKEIPAAEKERSRDLADRTLFSFSPEMEDPGLFLGIRDHGWFLR